MGLNLPSTLKLSCIFEVNRGLYQFQSAANFPWSHSAKQSPTFASAGERSDAAAENRLQHLHSISAGDAE